MNRSKGRLAITAAVLGRSAASLALVLLPSAAAAQITVPVVVQITELVQLADADFDSLGDMYAEVSINGTTFNNVADNCSNPPPQGTLLPYVFFSESGILDPTCLNVPWTFAHDVPLSDFQGDQPGEVGSIPVRITILDSDSGLAGGDDLVREILLNVEFGGRWTGQVNWPNNCVRTGGAAVCWRIQVADDADGDGLLDDWEQNGLDVDDNGSIDLDLPALGADPLHKDIFVELDWRPGFEPQRLQVQRWKEAFEAAPIDAGGVPNPDGLPGINLHVDTGALTENGLLVGDNLGGGNALAAEFPVCSFSGDVGAFYPAKAQNFDEATRGLVFRYAITSTRCCISGPDLGMPCFINSQCDASLCTSAGGQGELGGNDFVVWNESFQGSTLMHELGHTLALEHGGDVPDNCKPDYLSVMNYDHFEIQRLDGSSILDYSPPRQPDGARGTAPLPDLVEDNLDEPSILDPADPHHFIAYTDTSGTKRLALVGAPIDWNGNGNSTQNDLSVNIDTADLSGFPADCTNNSLETLTGHDDWLAVSLPFLQFGDSADGPVNPVLVREPTDAEIMGHRQALNTADLAASKSGPAGPVEAGQTVDLAYMIDLVNQGPNPAVMVRVSDVLPPGGVVLTHDPECAAATAGELTCNLPALLPGSTASVALSVRAPARCANGLPTAIVNQVSVENSSQFAGADPGPSDNTATFETAVVDTTPPTLELTASPAILAPPNHDLIPVTISVVSTDACDDSPTIQLVSITSSEPDDIKGAGQTEPDIQQAAIGTDDREFLLRAERSGLESGRIYTIRYAATDASGNTTQTSVTVTVPKGSTH